MVGSTVVIHSALATDTWSKIGAVAGIVAAIATLFLAFKTWGLANQTRTLAGETKELAKTTADVATETGKGAKAAADEAAAATRAVEEGVRDRQLAWQPILSVEARSRTVQPREDGRINYSESEVTIRNIGTGPALQCAYASWSPDASTPGVGAWCFIRGFDLGAASERGDINVGSAGDAEPIPWELFGPLPGAYERVPWAMLCSDIFGNRYRFTPGRMEVSMANDADPPIWAGMWRG